MEAPPNFHAGHQKPQPAAQSLRPNLFQPTSSRRLSSDLQSGSSGDASTKKSHLHSLHHHPHRHRHHHQQQHRHSSRQHAKEVVQSAVQLHPPTSFGDLLKQAKGSSSSNTTPTHSRKGSVTNSEQVLGGNGNVRLRLPPKPRPVRPEDVERERRRVKVREAELRSALQTLSDQSLKTSRRLDDTYYSILEKVSLLRQTIGHLQDLSGLTKELHENFQTDSKELVEEVQGQVEGYGNFEAQQEQVIALEERIKLGKEKSDALRVRLDDAKERVEARAKVEAEWEARTTRRLRILWGILGAIASLILLSILFHQLKPIHAPTEPRAGLDFASRAKVLDAPIPDAAKEAIIGSSISMANSRMETLESNSAPQSKEDERLRIFDEL